MADVSRSLVDRVLPPLALIAAVGGFGLSFTGTLGRGTPLGWLGYPEYDVLAFVVGWLGLFTMVGYGYFAHGRSGDAAGGPDGHPDRGGTEDRPGENHG